MRQVQFRQGSGDARCPRSLKASGKSPFDFLTRHLRGDWSDVDAENFQANEHSVEHRLRSLPKSSSGPSTWLQRHFSSRYSGAESTCQDYRAAVAAAGHLAIGPNDCYRSIVLRRNSMPILLTLLLTVLASSTLLASYRGLIGNTPNVTEETSLTVSSAALFLSSATACFKSQTERLDTRENSKSRSEHPTDGSIANCSHPKGNLLAGWVSISDGHQLAIFFFSLVLAGRSPPSVISTSITSKYH